MARFFITCAHGIEDTLLTEARSLGLKKATRNPGGVAFEGSREEAMKACLWLRCATRVLQIVGGGPARGEAALYQAARAIPWERWIRPDRTFRVDATVGHSALTHSGYVALKVKDALVDRIRARKGRRPSVDTDRPDVRVRVRLHRDRATFSLDLAGEALHRRGWRTEAGEAPLKESLAAALVLASGWTPDTPLYDPFCGSGSILIEAAWIATHRAPGLDRRFAFEGLSDHKPGPWRALKDEARAAILEAPPAPILGADLDRSQVMRARKAAKAAGLNLRIDQADARQFTPSVGPGHIICNPPYGERLSEEEAVKDLYADFGDRLKESGQGCTLHLLTDRQLIGALRLKIKRRQPFFNGDIDCRLITVPVY